MKKHIVIGEDQLFQLQRELLQINGALIHILRDGDEPKEHIAMSAAEEKFPAFSRLLNKINIVCEKHYNTNP